MPPRKKTSGSWTDRVISTIQKNAQAEDKKAMAFTLNKASAISDNWTWIDFCDPATGDPCLLLEYLTGCRGMLCGRMVKIEAMEGVGKSSYCFLQYAMGQRQNAFCWHGESEHAPPPPDYIASFGCDPEALLIQQPGSIERAFYSMEEIVKTIRENEDPEMKNPIIASLDSVSGFGSDAQMDADELPEPGDLSGGLGAHARAVSRWFRDRGYILEKNKVLLLMTAQLKMKIEVGFKAKGGGGPKETTIAERPMNFHATMRIVMSANPLKNDVGLDVGDMLNLVTQKNKLSPKHRKVTLHHYRDHGFDMITPTCDWLREFSPWSLPDGSTFSISQAGAYIKSDRLLNGKSVHSNYEGKQEMMQAFYADPALLTNIRQKLRIRGFGFDFEKRYQISPEEAEDLAETDAQS